jgi:hypothetical protein
MHPPACIYPHVYTPACTLENVYSSMYIQACTHEHEYSSMYTPACTLEHVSRVSSDLPARVNPVCAACVSLPLPDVSLGAQPHVRWLCTMTATQHRLCTMMPHRHAWPDACLSVSSMGMSHGVCVPDQLSGLSADRDRSAEWRTHCRL